MTLQSDTLERPAPAREKLRVVDCDIHPTLAHPKALYPYLAQHWRDHLDQYGTFQHSIYAGRGTYPRFTPNTARRDAWPPSGGPPGSDLPFMQSQHLDAHDIEFGILEPLVEANVTRNTDLSAAMCSAVNEWQLDVFASKEPRLKASIVVCAEDAEGAVKEIQKHTGDRRFAQVQLGARSLEPIGRKRYWPIFAAAQEAGLPLGFHVGGPSAYAPSASGWPSFYVEDHHVLTHGAQAQVSSMILEGVFEIFPKTRIVMIENGFAWAPPLSWRLDRLWTRMRSEVPNVKRPPSEYMRQCVWFATQPVEEPERREDLRALFDWIGWDRMMFSSDYPHWDFDDPKRAIQLPMSEAERAMLFHDNATAFYNLDA
jgi:predicted TIM-barrel fold metal-dependent hydrolase